MKAPLSSELTARIERLSGKRIATAVRPSGGYTPALRLVLAFADGSSAFAKVGTTPLVAQWLRREAAR